MKKLITLIMTAFITCWSFGQISEGTRVSTSGIIRSQSFSKPGYARDIFNLAEPWHAGMPGTESGSRQEKSLAIMQRLDNYIYQTYDAASSQWVNSAINEFLYDVNGNNTSYIYSTWNVNTLVYDRQNRQEIGYDENGYVISETFAFWDTITEQWHYTAKWEYTYNGDGTVALQSIYRWDETTSTWTQLGKDEYIYNSNRSVVLQINYIWNPGTSTWVNSNKTETEYNSNGYVSRVTYYSWNTMNNVWKNISKTEYEYNTDGTLAIKTTYQWNLVSAQWENNDMYAYTYDANAMLTEELFYDWDTTILQWVNSLKEDYTWDGNLNMIMDLYYTWNGSLWVIVRKDEYSYNNDFTYDQLILPYIFQQAAVEFHHMRTGFLEYQGNPLALTAKTTFNYSEVEFNDIKDNTAIKANVFPQPAKGQVTFRWQRTDHVLDLILYDANQRIVIDKQIENNAIVPVEQLAPGLYFYKLTGKSGVLYAGKLSIR